MKLERNALSLVYTSEDLPVCVMMQRGLWVNMD